jgi:two-component system response regulator DesR
MSNDPIRCLIADDHPLMREIIRMRVESVGFEVVAEACDGEHAVRLAAEHRPDVAVIDIQMPTLDGVAVLDRFAELELPVRSLVLTSGGSATTIRRAMAAGAHGFIGKASSQDLVEQALRAVGAGQRFIDPMLAGAAYDEPAYDLSPRELEVLTLMAEGLPNKVIAIQTGISQETVKTHVSSLLSKLNVSSRSGAIAMAIREQLVA